ncbi:3-deoxy-7-phosphoheptulonate synthase [Armatimonas sp.]|uniref:3-deoxy-7-phosphoheptulonate synthase n=1 Tax=Armatimonas sp. TaxID=1872638 RepID=UPI00286BE411|nr:3-deoxy-7-phosphoheptulonate synthase [Armatimonas sp.]
MSGLERTYRLAARDTKSEPTVVTIGQLRIGEGCPVMIMAGPCTVESREQTLITAHAVKAQGATVLRGGAYKPSTSPYSFQGLGIEGLEILAEAKAETGLAIITEVMDPRNVELVCRYADILQIGTRSMQNYDLLREVGKTQTPVCLKRGMSATLAEWLQAAEYILLGGNPNVILCERGIRTFETYTRNTLDLAAVPSLRELTHLPIIVDPSQGTGRASLVAALSRGAVAVGADGLLIEVHPDPENALKDALQQVTPEEFAALMDGLRPLADAINRGIA